MLACKVSSMTLMPRWCLDGTSIKQIMYGNDGCPSEGPDGDAINGAFGPWCLIVSSCSISSPRIGRAAAAHKRVTPLGLTALSFARWSLGGAFRARQIHTMTAWSYLIHNSYRVGPQGKLLSRNVSFQAPSRLIVTIMSEGKWAWIEVLLPFLEATSFHLAAARAPGQQIHSRVFWAFPMPMLRQHNNFNLGSYKQRHCAYKPSGELESHVENHVGLSIRE